MASAAAFRRPGLPLRPAIAAQPRVRRQPIPKIAVALLMVAIVVAVAGARLASGASLEGFLRSVQIIDLLLPFLAVAVLAYFRQIVAIIGRPTMNTGFLFLLAAAFSAVAGHFVVEGDPSLVTVATSILFVVKEIEFLMVLGFAAIVTYDRPVAALRAMGGACVFLALWTIKEAILPSGLYAFGLPFEAGPSQTGAVYALFTFVWIVIVIERWPRAGWVMRWVVAPAVLLLLIGGNFGSLSRTGQAGMIAGLAAIGLARARSWPAVLIAAPLLYIVYVLAFTDTSAIYDASVTERWNTAADNFPDRVVKWVAMFDFMRDNAWTFLTGCGFNSPNAYVLYQFSPDIDLGNVLAVDNGYVRRLFELGIIGAGLYFAFLGRLFLALWQTRFAAVAAGAFLAMFTIAMAIESFQVTQTIIAFFLFCGFVMGLAKRQEVHGLAAYRD